MEIVVAASECVPFAKTGGLGEAVGALPRELVKLGHSVTVYLPQYRGVLEKVQGAKTVIASMTIPFPGYNRFVSVADGGMREGVQFYFLDCEELFDREGLYGTAGGEYQDNAERYGLYCRAVIEAAKRLGVPDVFHVHDWQGSMVPVMLRTLYANDAQVKNVPVVLTIHDVAYQGLFGRGTTEKLLLPWDLFSAEKLEFFNQFAFLKGGILYADAIATVSRRYAEEIQTAEFGHALEGVLRGRANVLKGIPNGADYAEWNPAKDRNIAAHYSAEKLDGKKYCRQDLLHAFALDGVKDGTAVVGMVSRLITQKGIDLVLKAADELLQEDVAVVVLGTGEAYYENQLKELEVRHPGRFKVRIAYDVVLSHKIEAGADIFLMPSRYEPAGVNQMYSLKYGTVPVVRATGGLDDAIEEWNPEAKSGTGFKFHGYEAGDLVAAMKRALGAFGDKAAWTQLMLNGMAKDFGWGGPAKEYVQLYEAAVRGRS